MVQHSATCHTHDGLACDCRFGRNVKLLLDRIDQLVWQIRGDWTDPRGECREAAEAVARLKEILFAEPKGYRNGPEGESDEAYYKRIAESLAEDEEESED